jgi:hypothetical protein
LKINVVSCSLCISLWLLLFFFPHWNKHSLLMCVQKVEKGGVKQKQR